MGIAPPLTRVEHAFIVAYGDRADIDGLVDFKAKGDTSNDNGPQNDNGGGSNIEGPHIAVNGDHKLSERNGAGGTSEINGDNSRTYNYGDDKTYKINGAGDAPGIDGYEGKYLSYLTCKTSPTHRMHDQAEVNDIGDVIDLTGDDMNSFGDPDAMSGNTESREMIVDGETPVMEGVDTSQNEGIDVFHNVNMNGVEDVTDINGVNYITDNDRNGVDNTPNNCDVMMADLRTETNEAHGRSDIIVNGSAPSINTVEKPTGRDTYGK